MTPTEWRQKHPRCRFCEHDKNAWDQAFCEAKQKCKSYWIPRWFCKWQGLYEVRK